MRHASLALLCLPGLAWGGEFRRIVVSPGLVLEGEVLETTSEGFRVRVAQGEVLVAFEDVEDLAALGEDELPLDIPWTVVVDADASIADAVVLTYGALPGVIVQSPSAWDAAHDASLTGCEQDLDCLAQGVSGAEPGWVFVATATDDGGSGITVETLLVPSGRERRVRLLRDGVTAWLDGARTSLGLVGTGELDQEFSSRLNDLLAPPAPDTAAPVAERSPARARRTWTARRVAAMSFVPVPGLPSLLQGDHALFGASLATTAALTAGWVGATGWTSTSQGERIAIGVAGAYVSTVVSNQLFGQLSRGRARPVAALHPTFDRDRIDGMVLMVHWAP